MAGLKKLNKDIFCYINHGPPLPNAAQQGRELASVPCLRWLADSFLSPRLRLAEGTHLARACPIVNRSRRRSRQPTFRFPGGR
jgi:hypothetical protein